MHDLRTRKLADFVAWAALHVTGEEKGQAQIFLDRLFQAFAQKGSLDVGGTAEFRVKRSTEDGGGTSFADHVWKPVVLIEMKRGGGRDATARCSAVDRRRPPPCNERGRRSGGGA